MRVVALALALLVLALVLGTAVVFVWLRLDPRRSPRARLLRAFGVELVSFVPMQLLVPLGLLLWPPWWRRPRRAGEEPIVFLHGYTQSAANFYLLAARLRRAGRGSLFAVNHFTLGGVAASARRLAAAVESIRRTTQASAVHLVGHSMGGVVARYYVERGGGGGSVRSITTLCSPHGGTDRARLGFDPSANDMKPQSDLLAHRGPPPPHVRYHSVWSHADPVVVPAETAALPGAAEELVLDGDGHFSPLLNRSVAASILKWVKEAEQHSLNVQ